MSINNVHTPPPGVGSKQQQSVRYCGKCEAGKPTSPLPAYAFPPFNSVAIFGLWPVIV